MFSLKALNIPSNYFQRTDLFEINTNLLNFDERLEWARVLQLESRESMEFLENGVSLDYIQRNFHDEIPWFYQNLSS